MPHGCTTFNPGDVVPTKPQSLVIIQIQARGYFSVFFLFLLDVFLSFFPLLSLKRFPFFLIFWPLIFQHVHQVRLFHVRQI